MNFLNFLNNPVQKDKKLQKFHFQLNGAQAHTHTHTVNLIREMTMFTLLCVYIFYTGGGFVEKSN